MKSMPASMPVNSHSGPGFPPPPPNPMAFANPPVASAPAPIPNGIGIPTLYSSPGAAHIYQQQVGVKDILKVTKALESILMDSTKVSNAEELF